MSFSYPYLIAYVLVVFGLAQVVNLELATPAYLLLCCVAMVAAIANRKLALLGASVAVQSLASCQIYVSEALRGPISVEAGNFLNFTTSPLLAGIILALNHTHKDSLPRVERLQTMIIVLLCYQMSQRLYPIWLLILSIGIIAAPEAIYEIKAKRAAQIRN